MIHYIARDMISMLRYLPYAVLVGLPVTQLVMILMRKRQNAAKGRCTWVAVSLFGIYFSALIMITLLSRESGSRIGMDLKLFSTWGINARNNAYVVENVILFIPYGFLLQTLLRPGRHLILSILTGFITSLMIESIQLWTHRGYFQIDDIVMNMLGMLCGWGLYHLIRLGWSICRTVLK